MIRRALSLCALLGLATAFFSICNPASPLEGDGVSQRTAYHVPYSVPRVGLMVTYREVCGMNYAPVFHGVCSNWVEQQIAQVAGWGHTKVGL